jgi:hypothetical protein
MSVVGQNAKYSLRADVFCFASNNGHRSTPPACLKSATSRLMHRSNQHLYSIKRLDRRDWPPARCRASSGRASSPRRLELLRQRACRPPRTCDPAAAVRARPATVPSGKVRPSASAMTAIRIACRRYGVHLMKGSWGGVGLRGWAVWIRRFGAVPSFPSDVTCY